MYKFNFKNVNGKSIATTRGGRITVIIKSKKAYNRKKKDF